MAGAAQGWDEAELRYDHELNHSTATREFGDPLTQSQ